eukprot:6363191-Pyramimonas_sp.AAC.1
MASEAVGICLACAAPCSHGALQIRVREIACLVHVVAELYDVIYLVPAVTVHVDMPQLVPVVAVLRDMTYL